MNCYFILKREVVAHGDLDIPCLRYNYRTLHKTQAIVKMTLAVAKPKLNVAPKSTRIIVHQSLCIAKRF